MRSGAGWKAFVLRAVEPYPRLGLRAPLPTHVPDRDAFPGHSRDLELCRLLHLRHEEARSKAIRLLAPAQPMSLAPFLRTMKLITVSCL